MTNLNGASKWQTYIKKTTNKIVVCKLHGYEQWEIIFKKGYFNKKIN